MNDAPDDNLARTETPADGADGDNKYVTGKELHTLVPHPEPQPLAAEAPPSEPKPEPSQDNVEADYVDQFLRDAEAGLVPDLFEGLELNESAGTRSSIHVQNSTDELMVTTRPAEPIQDSLGEATAREIAAQAHVDFATLAEVVQDGRVTIVPGADEPLIMPGWERLFPEDPYNWTLIPNFEALPAPERIQRRPAADMENLAAAAAVDAEQLLSSRTPEQPAPTPAPLLTPPPTFMKDDLSDAPTGVQLAIGAGSVIVDAACFSDTPEEAVARQTAKRDGLPFENRRRAEATSEGINFYYAPGGPQVRPGYRRVDPTSRLNWATVPDDGTTQPTPEPVSTPVPDEPAVSQRSMYTTDEQKTWFVDTHRKIPVAVCEEFREREHRRSMTSGESIISRNKGLAAAAAGIVFLSGVITAVAVRTRIFGLLEDSESQTLSKIAEPERGQDHVVSKWCRVRYEPPTGKYYPSCDFTSRVGNGASAELIPVQTADKLVIPGQGKRPIRLLMHLLRGKTCETLQPAEIELGRTNLLPNVEFTCDEGQQQ